MGPILNLDRPERPQSLASILAESTSPSATDLLMLSTARQLSASIGTIPPVTEHNTAGLQELTSTFRHDARLLNRRYGAELDRSRLLLQRSPNQHGRLPTWSESEHTGEQLERNLEAWTSVRDELLQRIIAATRSIDTASMHLENAQLRPRVTWGMVFEQLSHHNRPNLSRSWKKCLAEFGGLFMMYQRALTLYLLHSSGKWSELFKELSSPLYDTSLWENYPDWLLIQVRQKEQVRREKCLYGGRLTRTSEHAQSREWSLRR